jgi:2-phosphoglycerate kinase
MDKESRKGVRRIIIIDEQGHELPFSKGLTAGAIMASGLSPGPAYDVASKIEDRFISDNRFQITAFELHQTILEILREEMGERYAESYSRYHALSRVDKPLVILIGGATGVGKSTIATMLAARLGIVRIVSTDAVREVMRAFFSPELMPAIHSSSFDAAGVLRQPLPASIDPVVAGFREQTVAVAVGVKALVERAATEGTHMIIEGAHVVPGFIDTRAYEDRAFLVPLVVTVGDAALHRSHFYIRELDTQGTRPFERYLANFESIRKIQYYIINLARSYGVKIVDSINLDATINEVIDYIINTVYEMETAAFRS